MGGAGAAWRAPPYPPRLRGYELKPAVGTSVFIMAFTAFTGAASHFAIGGMPHPRTLVLGVLSPPLRAANPAPVRH